ncbi:MAG TPA: hypothetical protein VF383_13805 [Candidatus Dormibacteraeota bacterium]
MNCDSGQPICDFVFAGKKTDSAFFAAIHGSAAGKPLLISFGVSPFSGPGSYRTDNQEGGTAITVDGPTHWVGKVGDSIGVVTSSAQILTGSLDSSLTAAAGSVRLTGTWVCDRVSSGR